MSAAESALSSAFTDALVSDRHGRPVAALLAEMELVLTEQQVLVQRLNDLQSAASDAPEPERASIQHHMDCHARDINRLFAELGMIEPPDGPRLG